MFSDFHLPNLSIHYAHPDHMTSDCWPQCWRPWLILTLDQDFYHTPESLSEDESFCGWFHFFINNVLVCLTTYLVLDQANLLWTNKVWIFLSNLLITIISTNHIYNPLNKKEFMFETRNLANYRGLENLWVLEENLQPPLN